MYFTPTATDLKIGYELELHRLNNGGWWEPIIIKHRHDLKNMLYIIDMISPSELRVPYLSAQHLEKDSWEHCTDEHAQKLFEHHELVFKKGNTILYFNNNTHDCTIHHDGEIVFKGRVKSINDLRSIISLTIPTKEQHESASGL